MGSRNRNDHLAVTLLFPARGCWLFSLASSLGAVSADVLLRPARRIQWFAGSTRKTTMGQDPA